MVYFFSYFSFLSISSVCDSTWLFQFFSFQYLAFPSTLRLFLGLYLAPFFLNLLVSLLSDVGWSPVTATMYQ